MEKKYERSHPCCRWASTPPCPSPPPLFLFPAHPRLWSVFARCQFNRDARRPLFTVHCIVSVSALAQDKVPRHAIAEATFLTEEGKLLGALQASNNTPASRCGQGPGESEMGCTIPSLLLEGKVCLAGELSGIMFRFFYFPVVVVLLSSHIYREHGLPANGCAWTWQQNTLQPACSFGQHVLLMQAARSLDVWAKGWRSAKRQHKSGWWATVGARWNEYRQARHFTG